MNVITLKGFFGFTRHPFPPVCPPEPLFRSERAEAAMTEIRAAFDHRMHALLVAPAGFGKTCLVRLLLADLNPRDFHHVFLAGLALSVTEWIGRVAEAFGIETAGRRGAAARLLKKGLDGMRVHPVLAIDDASLVPLEAIDLLRSLAEEGDRPRLSILLVGDESLSRKISRHIHAPLSQRLAVRRELAPLSENEAAAFVDHAFSIVGMQNILAPGALAAVYSTSGGAPRKIASLLASSMHRALEKRSKILSEEIVQEILDDGRN